MTNAIIIVFCVLILIAYLFDLTASRTRIPSVILLLLLGWLVRQSTDWLAVDVPDLSAALPVFGTVGLILIVLEGSLELELTKDRIPLIKRASWMAFWPMILLAIVLAWLMTRFGFTDMRLNLLNITPLCVISSAIAIPTAQSLQRRNKEFIVYESSLSDILGVLLFNFLLVNTDFGFSSLGIFLFQLILIALVSFVSIVFLTFLLNRINHHIKFVPIIMLIVLIYALSKIYHLPGLIFILLFGLFLGNVQRFAHMSFIQRFKPEILRREVHRFHEIIAEGTFLVRVLFFVLFGFLIETDELLNLATAQWSAIIVAAIFVLRWLFLTLFRQPLMPLWFIAPRGLITILLFLSIPAGDTLSLVNKSLLTQVIVLTALIMMFGMIFNKSNKNDAPSHRNHP
jgi:Kef-type K+ transport system membrane component KefB